MMITTTTPQRRSLGVVVVDAFTMISPQQQRQASLVRCKRGSWSYSLMNGCDYSQSSRRTPLFATTNDKDEDGSSSSLPDIASMKAGEMRDELQSYGISTKSFFEKSELKTALEQARAEGKIPIKNNKSKASRKKVTTEPVNGEEPINGEAVNGEKYSQSVNGETINGDESSSKIPRSERIQQEMEKAKRMSVGDLRKELKNRGVSTKSFFEKTEFVKAYAEAVVDGTQSSSSSSSSKRRQQTREAEEEYDPAYRDVTVQKMGRQDQQRLLEGGSIIDVTAKSTRR